MQKTKSYPKRNSATQLQRAARERADDQARRIPWQRLYDARNRYIDWQEFYLWVRSILEVEDRISAIFLTTLAAFGQNASRFDGTWNTTVTCEPKGGALGYTLHFVSTVSDGVLHGERGTKGQPAYLAIDGKIGNGGNAKLTASGNTASAAYTHGPIKTEGEEYSYEVKSQFTDTEGKGDRSTGLGIVGRPCHWTFEKQAAEAPKP